MRTLSEYEKRIVRKLCADSQYFSDLFEKDFLREVIVEYTNDSLENLYEIKFQLRKDLPKGKTSSQHIYEATQKIVETINLIYYLQSEYYIYSFKAGHGIFVKGKIGLKDVLQEFSTSPEKFIGSQYPDTKTRDFIFDNMEVNFAATQALKEYLRNDFRTDDEIKHSQNIKIAWIAIGISIALGLVSLLFN